MCVCVCASAFVLDYVSAWAKLHKPESSERQQLFLGQQKKENSCRSSGNYKNLSTLPTDQQSLVIMQSHCLQLSITIPLLFLLLALQQSHSQNAGFNYCQPGLCPLMKKHIACRNNGVSNEGSSFCKPCWFPHPHTGAGQDLSSECHFAEHYWASGNHSPSAQSVAQ